MRFRGTSLLYEVINHSVSSLYDLAILRAIHLVHAHLYSIQP